MTQTNQGALISALQTELGAGFEDRTLEGLWHELWDANSVAGTTFNERMLNYLNEYLGTSYTYLPQAMQAYAEDQGFYNWSSIGTWDLTLNPAAQLVNTWSSDGQGLGLIFEGAKPGIYVKDTGTPANDTNITATNDFDAFSAFLTKTAVTPKITRQADGYYKYQAHNLALQSEDFSVAQWTKSNATATTDTITDASAGAAGFVSQTLTLQVGLNYTYKLRVTKDAIPSSTRFVDIRVLSTSNHDFLFDTSTGEYNTINTAWQSVNVVDGGTYWDVELTFRCLTASSLFYVFPAQGSVADITTAAVSNFSNATTGSVTITRVHVRRAPSVDTYLPTTTAARYALPIQYDASGVAGGLLVEPAATNLVTYSNDLTAWSLNLVTASKTATGPDGVANSATTLTATAGDGFAFITAGFAGQRVLSLFVKRRTGAGVVEASYDNGATYTALSVTSIWARVSIPAVSAGSGVIRLRIKTLGDAIDVWGVLGEAGDTPTSPIITAGATVTRTADDSSKALSALPFDAAAGTLYVKYEPRAVATLRDAVRLDDGTADEVISIGHSAAAAGRLTVTDGGAAQTAPLTSGTVVASADNKIAASFAANDFAISEGGAAASTDTSGTMPTVTTLDVGVVNGLVKEVLYLPEALSDANIASLST